RLPAVQYHHGSGRRWPQVAALPAGNRCAGRRLRLFAGGNRENGSVVFAGEKSRSPDGGRDRALAHGLRSPYFAGNHWNGRRTICASAARGSSRHRRHETIELFARVLRRRRGEHGHCAGGDQRTRSPHQLNVRLDAALHDQYLHHHHGDVLDCVRLSLPVGQRDFDAWHVDAVGDGVCQIARYASAAARHDLDILRRWKALAYQSGVLIVGYSYGYFAARDLVRMGACLTVVEFLALLLLVPFYWPLIGLK